MRTLIRTGSEQVEETSFAGKSNLLLRRDFQNCFLLRISEVTGLTNKNVTAQFLISITFAAQQAA